MVLGCLVCCCAACVNIQLLMMKTAGSYHCGSCAARLDVCCCGCLAASARNAGAQRELRTASSTAACSETLLQAASNGRCEHSKKIHGIATMALQPNAITITKQPCKRAGCPQTPNITPQRMPHCLFALFGVWSWMLCAILSLTTHPLTSAYPSQNASHLPGLNNACCCGKAVHQLAQQPGGNHTQEE